MTITRYLLISLPLHESASALWTSLQQSISRISFDIPTYKLHIPDLRVGTLDSLLALSDDLLKASSVVEGITHKIQRQIEELDRASGNDAGTLSVEGVPIDSYITRFTWDEAKYPLMTPLNDIVETILDSVSKLEDDLKVRVAEYSNVKTQLSSINRKQTGSMAVRELSSLVKSEDIISTDYLTTLLVVVSKYSQKEWISTYETLSDFVVPRSSQKLHEDNEYALYTVVVFRKVADTFRTVARERSFQVREYEHDPEGRLKQEEDLENLIKDQDNLRNNLQQWCFASYGEVFSSWMHICVVRLFAESILRYGLPPAFLAAVLAPSTKNEKKIRVVLEKLSGGADSSFWKADDDLGMIGLTGGDSDVHPYVSLTINLAG